MQCDADYFAIGMDLAEVTNEPLVLEKPLQEGTNKKFSFFLYCIAPDDLLSAPPTPASSSSSSSSAFLPIPESSPQNVLSITYKDKTELIPLGSCVLIHYGQLLRLLIS